MTPLHELAEHDLSYHTGEASAYLPAVIASEVDRRVSIRCEAIKDWPDISLVMLYLASGEHSIDRRAARQIMKQRTV